MGTKLSERKQKILGAIVDDYLNTAEPVGSSTISKKYLKKVSPATIRNEMAALEEEGYIKQPHISAGRVPSDLGYRYYVDSLMHRRGLSPKDVDFIKVEYKKIGRDIEDILKTTAKILSSLSDYATTVTAPKLHRRVVKIVNMVLLDIHRAAIVLLTDSGQTDNVVMKLKDEKLTQDDLGKMSNFLTAKLNGVNVHKLNSTLIKAIASEMPTYKDILEDTLNSIKTTIMRSGHDKVLSAGLSNIAKQPEFNNIEHMKSILELVEHDNLISKLMEENRQSKGVTIKIGTEIKIHDIHDCSIALTRYSIADETFGSLGIIGPTRMHYEKITSIMEYVSDMLNDIFTGEEM